MAKYYAVKNGKEVGIFTSWKECKPLVEGFSGAEYKSFATKTEAKEYLGIEVKKKIEPPKPNTRVGTPAVKEIDSDYDAVFYVDGSYNIETKDYSFGCVMLKDGEMFTFSHKYDDPEAASMRNVAGEIAGASFAMKYAVKIGLNRVLIVYDYEGIARWAKGEWKANLKHTKEYAILYRKLSDYIKVDFMKVKGHSGDIYNDMADRLAKNELGIK
ncbi:MAG: ribonuclease H family protein [Clostridia bacterium]|nr:ribonuclease H family protein [Clostridia bacterium]